MTESIRVENVTKDFTLRYHRTFKQVTVAKFRGQRTKDEFNAVDDVSFTVKQGESIGLMGLLGIAALGWGTDSRPSYGDDHAR